MLFEPQLIKLRSKRIPFFLGCNITVVTINAIIPKASPLMTRCNLNPSAFAAVIFLSLLFKSSSYLRTQSAGRQSRSSCITTLHREFLGSLQTTDRLEVHGNSLARLPFSIRSRSQRSFALSVGNWWEDDLPNILGINPFEAALLFGALYKFYGPGVLYEFAREAGKLFSTYAPIVRDLSLDIFNEGKDYLEEDRDRELMRKGGVDIDNMPRKTTNIIERFQAGMEVRGEIEQSRKRKS